MHTIDISAYPELRSIWTSLVPRQRTELLSNINTNLSRVGLNQENLTDHIGWYHKWRKENWALNYKCDETWSKLKNKHLIKDIVIEQKDLNNSNINSYKEFLQSNKETILSELTKTTSTLPKNKPLGAAGDISINDLINKGIEVVDTPLVQIIKENVNVSLLGSFVSSMILYKTVLNMYMKAAYNYGPNQGPLNEVCRRLPSTRSREIALFMMIGGPIIVAQLMVINKVTGVGSKVILSVTGQTELEAASSVSSSSSLFLFLNKLPRWLKAILKYITLYFIGLIFVKILDYNTNIAADIYSQFNVILIYFLKLWTIFNLIVVIYFALRIYVLKMFSNNKEFINPENYPNFIKMELIELKEIAIKGTPIEKDWVYKHNYFLIKLYISIALFGLTGVILGSNYLIPNF